MPQRVPRRSRAVIIGAGLGGLACAVELSRRGIDVCVLERAAKIGGKMREIIVDGRAIDSGPTVLTMRWVFDELFSGAGSSLDAAVELEPMEVLARHGWSSGARLDLFADPEQTADAIGRFASAADVRGYRRFCEYTQRIFEIVRGPFIADAKPTVTSLVRSLGWRGLRGIGSVDFHRTMWRALADFFPDPRLRQLFGRYATYYGSSPFAAPATLNLIAHVERSGVWTVKGGMYRLAEAIGELAQAQGATIRCDAEVAEILVHGGRVGGVRLRSGEVIEADQVVANADVWALDEGLLGPAVVRAVKAPDRRQRSFSALTWSMVARADGFPLSRHSVFFSDDYAAEFEDLCGARRLPRDPTVYICAQDRGSTAGEPAEPSGAAERLFVLVCAPAQGFGPSGPSGFGEGAKRRTGTGKGAPKRLDDEEIRQCEAATFRALGRCGLELRRDPLREQRTTPDDFARMFPATGGALYGAATHGWTASLSRPGARSKVPGLYLVGGSVHPGAGVPMVTLSGRFAASAVVEDLASTASSRRTGTRGGTSTR